MTYPWVHNWDQEASSLEVAFLDRASASQVGDSEAACEGALASFVYNFNNYLSYKYYNKTKGRKRSHNKALIHAR